MSILAKQRVKNESGATHSLLDFHKGEALCRVASAYPTLLDVILEQVQNAIDANARNISVVLNRKTRHIAIRDNGDGVSETAFTDALRQVCLSQKESGKLGRFGIGLISPLGKCDWFTFISSPRGGQAKYMEWRFVTDDVREQSSDVLVPQTVRGDLNFTNNRDGGGRSNSQKLVWWRTEVNIHGFSKDKLISRISNINTLQDAILERFSSVMRRNEIVLELRFKNVDGSEEYLEAVRAKQFTGRLLGEVIINDADAGKVKFNLYLAPKTTKGQAGKVLVGETDNDYRFGIKLFAKTADGFLSDDCISALLSGIFEGEITAEKVTLQASRKSFERDDAFVGFCTAIESWFKRHGEKHLEAASEERREQRYQDLGRESLRQIELMLNDPMFADIKSVLGGFKIGSVGEGHAPRPENSIAGKQPEKAVSTQTVDSGAANGHDTSEKADADSENPAHLPYTVAGPRGRRRTMVRHDSVGLQFSYIAMDGSDKLWELDSRLGILHFNVNHPIWVICDVSDRRLRQLQETVAVQALMLQAVPSETAGMLRMLFDDFLGPQVHLYQYSEAFNYLRKKRKEPDSE